MFRAFFSFLKVAHSSATVSSELHPNKLQTSQANDDDDAPKEKKEHEKSKKTRFGNFFHFDSELLRIKTINFMKMSWTLLDTDLHEAKKSAKE